MSEHENQNFGFIGTEERIWVPEKVEFSDENAKPVKISLCFRRLTKEQGVEIQSIVNRLQRKVYHLAADVARWDNISKSVYLRDELPKAQKLFIQEKLDVEEIDYDSLTKDFCEQQIKSLEDEAKNADLEIAELIRNNLLDWKMPGNRGMIAFSVEALEEAMTFEPYLMAFTKGLQRATGKKLQEAKEKN